MARLYMACSEMFNEWSGDKDMEIVCSNRPPDPAFVAWKAGQKKPSRWGVVGSTGWHLFWMAWCAVNFSYAMLAGSWWAAVLQGMSYLVFCGLWAVNWDR